MPDTGIQGRIDIFPALVELRRERDSKQHKYKYMIINYNNFNRWNVQDIMMSISRKPYFRLRHKERPR